MFAKLREMRAQFPAMSAEFTEERTTRLLSKPVRGNGTVAFLAPNRFRRELKGTSPCITVCNGRELWIYYPNFKEAEHYTLGQKQFFDDSLAALTAGMNFDDADRFFRVTPERVDDGWKIVLTPKSAGVRRLLASLTIRLNAEGELRSSEALLPKGDRVVTTYRNVRFAKTSDAHFDFKPPADANVSTPLGK